MCQESGEKEEYFMTSTYKQLSFDERLIIQNLLSDPNITLKMIALTLNRSPKAIRNDPDIDLFDLPCDSTIMRWKSKLSSLFDLETSLLFWHLPHSHQLSSFVQMTLPFHFSDG